MMQTKLPLIGNRVTSGRRVREGGIALISVISVLVLLAMVATPFLLTMRDSAARGEKFVYSNRADAEAEALFETVRSEMLKSVEHLERRKLDASAVSASGTTSPPADCTPTSDTADEFQLTPDVLQRFNRSTAKEHRVWAADIVDTQSLFNLNNCSFGVLANILGRAEVSAATTSDRQSIPLSRVPDSFPRTDGVVRIGSECIKYKQIVGNDLVNCERGYMGSISGNGPARDIELGEAVMLESCYQLVTRPFRWRTDKDGKTVWVRYTNVDQARTIGEMGVTTLPPADFERIRPYITAWNGNAVGDGWCNPQLVRNAITAGNKSDLYASIKNVRYFGPGTIVRITDGVNDDYAIVTKVRGTNDVMLAGNIVHDFQADQTRIYCLARSPININTADVSTLSLVFSGLKLRGKGNAVSESQATALAAFLKTWKRKLAAGETAPVLPKGVTEPVGAFRSWEDLTLALEEARDAGKIDQEQTEAVLKNAMNANDSTLQFSTVPFVFRSFDTYEVRAAVSIQGTGGHEVARRELRRVMEVSTTRSATFVLETQEDFQNQIIQSRDAKYMATYPVNVNAQYDGKNIPASEYQAYAQKSLFPNTDRSSGVGDVQLLPAAFRLTAGNRRDAIRHFDEERIPDGKEIKDSAFTMSVDQPYDPVKGTLDLVDVVSIPGRGEDIELGLKAFDVSFWYKPGWGRDNAEHVVFDYGLDADHMDRVSLRYDPRQKALVLACADATREQRSCEVIYPFDHGTWDTETWYHIAAHVHGCSPELMTLFVDGESAGVSNVRSRLTNTVPGTGTGGGLTLELEDGRDFPESGVVIVRGRDGQELFEYANKGGGNTLPVTRRKARSIVHTLNDAVTRSHQAGDTVELYGFAGPLLTDVKKGGSVLDAQIGPWRAYRMTYEGDELFATGTTPQRLMKGLGFPIGGWTSTQQAVDITLAEWDTGSTDPSVIDDLGPAGTEGLALLISPRVNINSAPAFVGGPASANVPSMPQSNLGIGGCDIIHYRVSNTAGAINIIARGVTMKHATVDNADANGNGYFFPSHEYGETTPDNTFVIYAGTQAASGAVTAIVPFAILASAGSGDYLDPVDREPQLNTNVVPNNILDPLLKDGHAYVQIDGEWVAYDSYDEVAVSGKVAFCRDMRIDDLAGIFGANDTNQLHMTGAANNPTTGQGGGSGGNSGNDAPGVATEFNSEAAVPPDPPTGGSVNATIPNYANSDITSVTISANLDFRGVVRNTAQTQHRIANTVPADHAANTQIIPAFLVASGNCLEQTRTQNDGARWPYPGFNDLITLRDANGNDEQVRVQWGYMGWCALTAPTAQTWLWDRPQGPDGNYALRRWDSRAWTRALKFPSGEMPDSALTKAKQNIQFGKGYQDASPVTPAIIDEIAFWQFGRPPLNRPNYAFLGSVPPEVADPAVQVTGTGNNPPPPTVFAGIDDSATEFACHMPVLDASGQVLLPYGVPIDANTYADDGGVVRIDDELIFFQQFDAETGRFTGCQRGAFNTEPKPHQYGAIVVGVYTFPTSRLTASFDASSGDYQLADTSDFADDGYLRVGLNSELIGYTNWSAGHLTAPLGRVDPAKDGTPRNPSTTDKRVGGSIFRGRFGTEPFAANEGDIAIGMPFRVYDRYAERADDPEQSYLQFSWTKHGAIWKRISWEDEPRKNIEVVALLRFSGGPAWDSDRIVNVGADAIPTDDRRTYLYQITDPKQVNLLNVEADRLELRLGVRFAAKAYDRLAQVAPDSWKETPAIRKVVVEYVAPPQVLTQEQP